MDLKCRALFEELVSEDRINETDTLNEALNDLLNLLLRVINRIQIEVRTVTVFFEVIPGRSALQSPVNLGTGPGSEEPLIISEHVPRQNIKSG